MFKTEITDRGVCISTDQNYYALQYGAWYTTDGKVDDATAAHLTKILRDHMKTAAREVTLCAK